MSEINLNDKWEPIQNVDPMKRKPDEWARIYNFKIFNPPQDLWSEYEWAYNLPKLNYMPLPDRDKNGQLLDSSEKATNMEIRGLELRRDIFMGADAGEKYVLEKQYMETEWCRRRINLL
jgi:hypothetical protein